MSEKVQRWKVTYMTPQGVKKEAYYVCASRRAATRKASYKVDFDRVIDAVPVEQLS